MDRGLVCVFCLVLVTGCGGVTLGDSGANSRTVNPDLQETPTRSPTATPTPDYPPGVDRNGTVGYNLSRAHRMNLVDRAVRLHASRRVITTDGTILEDVTITASYRNDSRVVRQAVAVSLIDRPGRRTLNYSAWGNATVTVLRYPLTNGSVEYAVDDTGPAAEPDLIDLDRTGSEPIARLLNTYRFRPTGTVTRNGTTLVVLEATTIRPDSVAADRQNISARMLVTATGIVRSYHVRYRTELYGQNVTVVHRFRVTKVGTATVPRPPWVDRALNGTRMADG